MTVLDEKPHPLPNDQDAKAAASKAIADLAGFFNVCMCILGDRLGLFKALAAHGPITSAELALQAGVQERYAREWLSQMACAGYLRYDPSSKQFSLPIAYQPILATEGAPNFLGGVYQNVQSLENGLFSKFIQAFQAGGGIPYSEYDVNYWEGLERVSTPGYKRLVHTYIPTMPDVHAALTRGALVADIGCARGAALIKLAQAFPQSRFVGYDAFEPNIAQARISAKAAGVIEQVQFMHHDPITGLPEQYDMVISFDSLHHAVDVVHMLGVIRQSLHPSGVYICSEPACADTLEGNIGMGGAMLYAGSVMVCVPQVLSEGSEALGAAGLPESTLRNYCNQVGFSSVRLVSAKNASSNVYEIRP